MHEFSARGSVAAGWRLFKKRPWFLIGAAFMIAIVGWVVSLCANVVSTVLGDGVTGGIARMLISLVGQTLLGMGTIAFYLKAHDHPGDVSLKTLWHPHTFWRYLGVTVLLMLVVIAVFVVAVLAGMALLVPSWGALSSVPLLQVIVVVCMILLFAVIGSIPVILLLFAPYFVIDRNMGVRDAVRTSMHISREHFWQLLLLMCCVIGINIIGVLALLIGTLVAAPVTGLSFVHAFRSLAVKGGHAHHA